MRPPSVSEYNDIAGAIFGTSQRLVSTAELATYFSFYRSLICPTSEDDSFISIESPILKSHSDVIRYINIIQNNPATTLLDIKEQVAGNSTISDNAKGYTIGVIVQLLYAIEPAISSRSSTAATGSSGAVSGWKASASLLDFIRNSLVQQLGFGPGRAVDLGEFRIRRLKAWKLRKRNRIRIRPTNNILEHLHYNPATRHLNIFHQIGYLKGQLEKTKHEPLDLTLEESLPRGTLPPRLLFEVLYTYHHILFPVSEDRKSEQLLRRLIRKYDFDPQGEIEGHARQERRLDQLEYLGERIRILHGIALNPPPTNRAIAWAERHSTERTAIIIALISLVVAAVSGALSFVVGLLQLLQG